MEWLDGGGRVDAMCIDVDASDITLLIAAAGLGHERLVAMLQRGASVDLKNSRGHTALMLTAGQGHERVVELLIRHGAEVNLQDNRGGTAL